MTRYRDRDDIPFAPNPSGTASSSAIGIEKNQYTKVDQSKAFVIARRVDDLQPSTIPYGRRVSRSFMNSQHAYGHKGTTARIVVKIPNSRSAESHDTIGPSPETQCSNPVPTRILSARSGL